MASRLKAAGKGLERRLRYWAMPLRVFFLLGQGVTVRLLLAMLMWRRRSPRRDGSILALCQGGIGDIVFVTPFFENVTLARPDAEIDVICPWFARDLLANNVPHVNRVIEFPPRVGRGFRALGGWRFLRELYRDNYETYVGLMDYSYPGRLPHNLLPSVLGFVSGAPRRVGIYRQANAGLTAWERWQFSLFFKRLALYQQYDFGYREDMHVVTERLGLLDLLDIEPRVTRPQLSVDKAGDREVAARLEGFCSPGDRLILCCPSSAWPVKQWSPVKFSELGRRLELESGARIVLAGSPDEKIGELINTLMGGSALVLSGPGALPGLSNYVALARRATLCISMDSGLGHIAEAVGTPVVMLFGPTPPGLTRPLPIENHRAVFDPQFRAHCPFSDGDRYECRPDSCPDFCINRIEVDTVFEAAQELMTRSREAGER
jgi:ADP-heptose:LPS heptosyltransferase